MLAFLAMTLAVFVASNQQKADLQLFESILDSEYEIMANAVALEQMEIVSAGTDWADLDVLDGTMVTRNFGFNTFVETFDLSMTVQFVDALGIPSAVPTTIKELTIVATNDRYNLPLVTHARLISD